MKKFFPYLLYAITLLFICFGSAKAQTLTMADAKYTEIARRGIQALSDGNIDKWMADFSDNARYYWNAGDSLIGKTAITQYWKERRGNVIETITFSNQIWLPIIVSQPQATESAGVWVLSWYQVNAKYKNGKTMQQWIHTDLHFDSNDKVDQVIQYLDRAPINAALAK